MLRTARDRRLVKWQRRWLQWQRTQLGQRKRLFVSNAGLSWLAECVRSAKRCATIDAMKRPREKHKYKI